MPTRKTPPAVDPAQAIAAAEFQAPQPGDIVELEPGQSISIPPDPGEQILAMIGEGMRAGQSIEAMQGLYTIYERHQATASAAAFGRAMAQFQAECPTVPKSSTAQIVTKGGARYSYTYAGLDEIVATVRPHLVAAGLSFTWNSEAIDGALVVSCTVRHAEGHEHTSRFDVPLDRSDRLRADQARSAALTVGRRQSLIQALGLTTGDPDTDGEAYEGSAGEPISADQKVELEKLLYATNSDWSRFLAYFKVETLEKLPAVEYPHALRMLRAKDGGKE